MEERPLPPSQAAAPRWRPLSAIDRRLIGVLVEKAKTTPDTYPMSTSTLRSGSNQKNNRYPLMELEIEDIEESLARLRAVGAVTEVQGGGRVARYRHHLYDWLGVDKVELSVMTELLLRGAQTEGELRGRVARMDPIEDLNALRPILVSLETKGLVISLTPEGRGHVVTHALYEPRELDKLRAEYSGQAAAAHSAAAIAPPPSIAPAVVPRAAADHRSHEPAAAASSGTNCDQRAVESQRLTDEMAGLRSELEDLRGELTRLRQEFDQLSAQLR